MLVRLVLKISTLGKMTHENSNFGNFEDERRKFGDPVARNRWFIFILAFVKQHFIEHILCRYSMYIM